MENEEKKYGITRGYEEYKVGDKYLVEGRYLIFRKYKKCSSREFECGKCKGKCYFENKSVSDKTGVEVMIYATACGFSGNKRIFSSPCKIKTEVNYEKD